MEGNCPCCFEIWDYPAADLTDLSMWKDELDAYSLHHSHFEYYSYNDEGFPLASETQIKQFREAFELPIYDKPTLLTEEEADLHMGLIREEFEELQEAVKAGDLVGVFDALIDLRYVAMGMGVHMNLPMTEGELIVHRSNMSKLDENGEPLYHDGTEGPVGKVKKSDLWWEADPYLEALIEQESQ